MSLKCILERRPSWCDKRNKMTAKIKNGRQNSINLSRSAIGIESNEICPIVGSQGQGIQF